MNKLLTFNPEPFNELDPEGEHYELDPMAGEWETEDSEKEVGRRRRPRFSPRAPRRYAKKPAFRPSPQARMTASRGKPSLRAPRVSPRPWGLSSPRVVPIPFIPSHWGPRPDLEPNAPRDLPRSDDYRHNDQAGSEGTGSPPTTQPSGEPASGSIRWVQDCLNRALGLQLPVDGIINRETRSAVRTFQERQGLTINGLVGPDTEAALKSACAAAPALRKDDNRTTGAEPEILHSASCGCPICAQRATMTNQLSFEAAPFAGGTERDPFETLDLESPDTWARETSGKSLQRVRWIQESLNRILGLQLKVDGTMGPKTRSAVRSFQQREGLAVDGVVGARTEMALRNRLGQATGSPTPAGYTPSVVRTRFEDAVSRRDWGAAYRNLNGLNMYEMLRALDHLSPASRTELVNQREGYRGIVNMPRIEYAVLVVVTRRLPPIAPGDLAATGQVQTAAAFLQAPAIDWTQVPPQARLRYVMQRVIGHYGLSQNGSAGLVGNLWAESGCIPNRLEGSSPSAPMTARDFNGNARAFSVEEIMNRNVRQRLGPKLPGIGLAQWTTASRRSGLFQHYYQGRRIGAAILFDMDAQIDYLVTELRDKYRGVYNTLVSPTVSLDAARDEVLYNFEVPGAILGPPSPASGRRSRLPRNDPRVQAVFRSRRTSARQALGAYRQQSR